MKMTTHRICDTAAFTTCALVMLVMFLSQPLTATAQWTTPDAAQNINNTNTGNVGVGTTTPVSPLHIASESTAGTRGMTGSQHSPDGNSFLFTFRKSRGTKLAPAAVVNGDSIFNLASEAYDGATYVNGGRIRFAIDGTVTSGSAPTAMQFFTGNNASGIERMRINSAGNVGIGTTSPTTALDVTGQIRSSLGFKFADGTVQTTASGITAVNAGSGLTGGGASGSLTLNVGAGTGLTVAADSMSVNYGSTAGTAVQGNTSITVSAGTGMSGGGPVTLGAGGSVTLTNNDRGSSQSIFKNIANAAGTTQFSAGSNTDALRFEGTGGTSVSFDTGTKKITVTGSGIPGWTDAGANIHLTNSSDNVGIGTTNPTEKLDITGNINVTGTGNITAVGTITGGTIYAKYQDVAEWVESPQRLSAGTVVVLDNTRSNQVIASTQTYDTRVAGVISTQPGIALGVKGEAKVLVATTGRVKIKADATCAPIQVGDLLVTGDREGFAMKSLPVNIGGVQLHRPGTLVGKALEPLANGTGEILVLLSLQ